MGLAFIPLYIKYLGIEAYGLIGLFAVLQAWLVLLDMGMRPTLSREMARFTGGHHSPQSIRDLLRTLEFITVGMAALIAGGVALSADWIATSWLQAEALPVEVVAQAFVIMGWVTALRFVESIYRSSILGLQRQVLFNVVHSVLATVRGLGAVAILAWFSPTIQAFFLWQGLLSFITLGILAGITYASLPRPERRAQFSLGALRSVWRFAGGMMGITFLSLLLMQADKLILSKLLTLSEFGYYALAATVAGALYMVVGPIGQAWFPKLTELQATQQQAQLIQKYHQGAQLVCVAMGSAALVMIVFAEVILQLWTRDNQLARHSANLLRLLALGNLLNGLMWIPYQTQLAHGWTGLATRINIAAVIIIVPAFILVIPHYGAEGAGYVWVGLNACYVLFGIYFMHRKILITEKWQWYQRDVLQPLLIAASVTILLAWTMPKNIPYNYKLVWLAATSILTLLVTAFGTAHIRHGLLIQLRQSLKIPKLAKTA